MRFFPFLSFLALVLTACGGSSDPENPVLFDAGLPFSTHTFMEAGVPAVKAGTRIWMARNLDMDTFRNGDPIPQAVTDSQWIHAAQRGQPAWCYYDNDPAMGQRFGRLYNWYAVQDPRGLAPGGWHIPSDAEWTALTDSLGGHKHAGGTLKHSRDWPDGGNGTNHIGFSALPAGMRNSIGGFVNEGGICRFWTATEINEIDVWSVSIYGKANTLYRYGYMKADGFSVRCVRDAETH